MSPHGGDAAPGRLAGISVLGTVHSISYSFQASSHSLIFRWSGLLRQISSISHVLMARGAMMATSSTPLHTPSEPPEHSGRAQKPLRL